MNKANTEIKVWDPFVRLAHWLLVASFIIAYITHEEAGAWHIWSGYAVGIVVSLRIIWGLIGSPHARFKDFLYSPTQALVYLRDLLRGRAPRYLGHSPAGGVMVFMLLICLSITTVTGLGVLALEENRGPLAGLVTLPADAAPQVAVSHHYEDDDEYDDHEAHESEIEERWEEVHEFFANFTVFLILLHIGGVALASFAHHENLPKAMVSGYKPRNSDSPTVQASATKPDQF